MEQLSNSRERGKTYRPGFRGIAIAVINHLLDHSQSGRFIDSAIVVLVGGNSDSRRVSNRKLSRFGDRSYSVSASKKHNLINEYILDTRSFNNLGRAQIK